MLGGILIHPPPPFGFIPVNFTKLFFQVFDERRLLPLTGGHVGRVPDGKLSVLILEHLQLLSVRILKSKLKISGKLSSFWLAGLREGRSKSAME